MRIRLTYTDPNTGEQVSSIYNWNDFVEWIEGWADYTGPNSFHAETIS
ncbi:hypothetical protein SEA_HANNABELLA_13 [Microbacterium phage Hannabella]|uniref:Uncharacterized protein n=1 Tax=Microbacterium phage Arete TaxID=2713257 RepID=A0A6G8R131_9CAUD|nr:hypothetical protein HWD16_gp14 [Microbacterium phage Arete]QIN93897.1 hypothetical protein SEA_ARETE_14 [Microbacterium phage Arete]URM86409.1 hypothetical protein SEA_GSHELBY23_12 [Microbacterium phage Gshelby23]UVG34220.1 hypothetical protein SEA_HANNABELLA_13 [Microbacterium phage Hannabella]